MSEINFFSDGKNQWFSQTLWKAAEDLPLEEIDLEQLLQDEEVRRHLEADLHYPIILGPTGHVLDGWHRILKAWALGFKTLSVKRLKEMPLPDGGPGCRRKGTMTLTPRYRCFACGRFTDEVTQGGPTPDEAGQAERWATGVLDVHDMGGDCRAAVACWPCFWKTDPDLWIGPDQWDALRPQIPYAQLPLFQHDAPFDGCDPALYPWPEEHHERSVRDPQRPD